MIAIFGNLAILEVLFIAAVAVMIFGRNLPRVAAQMYTHFQRARRALLAVWRESGIGDEIRQVQREMDRTAAALKQANPMNIAKESMQKVEASIRDPFQEDEHAPDELQSGEESLSEDTSEVDESVAEEQARVAEEEEDSVDEPAGEASRRPSWYPDTDADPFESPAD